MHKILVAGLFAGSLMAASFAVTSAGAIDKPGGGATAPATAKKMGPSKMTTQECGNFGGKVVSAVNVCMSGQACFMTGEDKKDHAVCITKTAN
jgi:hypothetical protein